MAGNMDPWKGDKL